jgi:hypothetical protein
MNTIKLISTLIAGLTFCVSSAANASDWGNFSQYNALVTLTSTNLLNSTVLRSVTVVCPTKGYLIAQAETDFFLEQGSTAGRSEIGYSLTLDSIAPIASDNNFHHLLNGSDPDGYQYMPAGMQRVVNCTARQSITINYVAYRLNAGPATYAWQPKLSVDFFEKRI